MINFFVPAVLIFRADLIILLVRCAFLTMDSAVFGLAASGCDCCTVRVFGQDFALEDVIGPPNMFA
jgi:hypothetical protein